ncbi:hypothetical protein LPJ79_005924, partial [Coemansia sp. RSA 1821]
MGNNSIAKTHAVKVFLHAVGLAEDLYEQLNGHVVEVNQITTYTFLFAKWIFLEELENPTFRTD